MLNVFEEMNDKKNVFCCQFFQLIGCAICRFAKMEEARKVMGKYTSKEHK